MFDKDCFSMEDLDESYFEINELEIPLDKDYFDKALDLLESNKDVNIKYNEISGISFWDIVSPIQDEINYANYGWVRSGGMFDEIDFSSDDDNTINMWYCVRDYLDEEIECKQPDINELKTELKLLDILKELSNGDFDTRIKIIRKDK